MLESFVANLAGVDWAASTLHLNLDPVPASGDGKALVAHAYHVFGHVCGQCPPEPSFPAAVKWCWAQPQGAYFFHLEDDWLLTSPVNLIEMADRLTLDPTLSLVNLRAYRHDDDRLCLAPGLWRTSHAKAIAERMRTDANPEMQLRKRSDKNPHGGLHEGYRGVQHPSGGKIVLQDMGRAWMIVTGMRRDQGRHFVRWKA